MLRVQQGGMKHFFDFCELLGQALAVRAAEKHFKHAAIFLDAERKWIIAI
jgi:hypothetical protein